MALLMKEHNMDAAEAKKIAIKISEKNKNEKEKKEKDKFTKDVNILYSSFKKEIEKAAKNGEFSITYTIVNATDVIEEVMKMLNNEGFKTECDKKAEQYYIRWE